MADAEQYDTILGSFQLGDLSEAEFCRAMRHIGVDEWEIEYLIHEFNSESEHAE